MLTKQSILAKNDQAYEDVPVPEWSEDGEEAYVRVRGLTSRERDAFEADIAIGEKVNYDNVRAKLFVRTVVDENGQLIFAETDVPLLGIKSAKALARVYTAAAKLSGLTKDDVESLAKNSGRARTGAHSSR
jgi:hypothetical protein